MPSSVINLKIWAMKSFYLPVLKYLNINNSKKKLERKYYVDLTSIIFTYFMYLPYNKPKSKLN